MLSKVPFHRQETTENNRQCKNNTKPAYRFITREYNHAIYVSTVFWFRFTPFFSFQGHVILQVEKYTQYSFISLVLCTLFQYPWYWFFVTVVVAVHSQSCVPSFDPRPSTSDRFYPREVDTTNESYACERFAFHERIQTCAVIAFDFYTFYRKPLSILFFFLSYCTTKRSGSRENASTSLNTSHGGRNFSRRGTKAINKFCNFKSF